MRKWRFSSQQIKQLLSALVRLLFKIWETFERKIFCSIFSECVVSEFMNLTNSQSKSRIFHFQVASNPSAMAVKNRKIEGILRDFPNERINTFDWDTGDETEAAEVILNDSVADEEKRHDLSKSLARSMRQIRGYQKLCSEVEERRLVKFSARNPDHEEELLKLWKLMKPDEPLCARRSVQWQDIGFQVIIISGFHSLNVKIVWSRKTLAIFYYHVHYEQKLFFFQISPISHENCFLNF